MSQEAVTKVRVRPGRKPKLEGRTNAVPENAGHVVARVTKELREALEAEAERTGRPLSRVAEKWLENGRIQGDRSAVAFADAKVAPLLIAINLTWEAVVSRLGPTSESEKSWQAMVSACRDVMLQMTPRPPINTGERMVSAAESAVCFLYEDLCKIAGLDYPFERLKWPGEYVATEHILDTVLSELANAGVALPSSRALPTPKILADAIRSVPDRLSPTLNRTLSFLEVLISYNEMQLQLDREALEASEQGSQIVAEVFPRWRHRRQVRGAPSC